MQASDDSTSNDHLQRRQIDHSPESPIIAPTSLANEALRLEIEMNMTGGRVARMSLTLRARLSRGARLASPEHRVHKYQRVVQHQEHSSSSSSTLGSPQGALHGVVRALSSVRCVAHPRLFVSLSSC